MREQQTRTTADLIRELEVEAAYYSTVALVVGFEHTTSFVFSVEDDKLTKLNNMVKEGGEPIGLLMVRSDEDRQVTSFACRPLEEYATEPWAQAYLERLIHLMLSLVNR